MKRADIIKQEEDIANNEIIIKNEIAANKHMISASVLTAILLSIIWFLFLFKVIPLRSYTLVLFFIPLAIISLMSTLLWQKEKYLTRPGLKYFLVNGFIIAVTIINVIIPKHGIIAWAACIIVANHYYNPRFGRHIFYIVLFNMLIALYAGMFFGEYDTNLLTAGVPLYDETTGEFIKMVEPDTVKGRYEMLHNLLLNGENRYLKVFIFYYGGRAIILTITFFISNALNIRTYHMLQEEISVSNQKQKIDTELEIAKSIQLSALPSSFPSSKNVEIIAELNPAYQVGGDFYYYSKIDDDHVAIVIGDVSGKGTPAAMFMMKTITCVKIFLNTSDSPSKILDSVNRVIYEGNDNSMFVTCFLGILDLQSGEFVFSNAGHNKPIIGNPKNGFKYLECKAGFVLGGLETTFLTDEKIMLNRGDIICLYTDGITEARNDKGEFYGDERLINFYNGKTYDSLIEFQYELKDNINTFVNGAPQADDMTYLFMKYQGEQITTREMTCKATIENIARVFEFVNNCLDEFKIGFLKNSMSIVVDELYSNIAKYAYGDGEGDVYIRFTYNDTLKQISITFIDKGVPFNQSGVETKTLNDTKLEDATVGQLGIGIVRNMVDSFAYNRINNKNILVIKKNLL